MKIRLGFVSNSSSSSYTVICQGVYLEDIKNTKDIYVEGKFLSEGLDFFPLTKDILKCIRKNEDKVSGEFSFYKVFKLIGEEAEVSKKDLPNKFKVLSIVKDQHSTDGLRNFMRSYIDEEGS